jgi:hypothetical protein
MENERGGAAVGGIPSSYRARALLTSGFYRIGGGFYRGARAQVPPTSGLTNFEEVAAEFDVGNASRNGTEAVPYYLD